MFSFHQLQLLICTKITSYINDLKYNLEDHSRSSEAAKDKSGTFKYFSKIFSIRKLKLCLTPIKYLTSNLTSAATRGQWGRRGQKCPSKHFFISYQRKQFLRQFFILINWMTSDLTLEAIWGRIWTIGSKDQFPKNCSVRTNSGLNSLSWPPWRQLASAASVGLRGLSWPPRPQLASVASVGLRGLS